MYVNYLIISGNETKAIHEFKTYLDKFFHMKDLGGLKYFLGVEVSRNLEGFLSQQKYALDIISDVRLLGANPVGMPLEQNYQLALAGGWALDDLEHYGCLIGRLIYLYFNRPKLSCSVHILSQLMQQPNANLQLSAT